MFIVEMLWLRSLFGGFGIVIDGVRVVFYDNVSNHHLACNPVMHAHTKHIEIDLYFV